MSGFCVLCNKSDCKSSDYDRVKVFYTSSCLGNYLTVCFLNDEYLLIAEMQFSSLWYYRGSHVDVNHENGGFLSSGGF